jgi:ATP-binding cassette, subfamily B, bacterial
MRPPWATGMRPGTAAVRRGLATPGRGQELPDGLVRRVWDEFARPYWKRLVAFLLAILVSSGLAVLPPVLFGALIDHGVLQEDLRVVTLLALAAVAIAIAAAGASLLQRWLSSWIGERLIFDLRRRMFDHVQRMPIAFFTRTQTGALISRMNNDVIGAQQAVTGTFGSSAANVVQLGAALVVMLSIEWRLTLLVLAVLPLFVIPARRVGQRLQGLTREGMELNARMNNRMTERFNVAGAMLVKLFGRFRVGHAGRQAAAGFQGSAVAHGPGDGDRDLGHHVGDGGRQGGGGGQRLLQGADLQVRRFPDRDARPQALRGQRSGAGVGAHQVTGVRGLVG